MFLDSGSLLDLDVLFLINTLKPLRSDPFAFPLISFQLGGLVLQPMAKLPHRLWTPRDAQFLTIPLGAFGWRNLVGGR